MVHLNANSRKNFNEWLESIDEDELQSFVFANSISDVEFFSRDFKLVHTGLSTGDPADCHMIEARVNRKTKDRELHMLLQPTQSQHGNQSCLAFALVPTAMTIFCLGSDIKRALLESPIPDQMAVNKVHVQWNPRVQWKSGELKVPAGEPTFVFEKIPFEKNNLDGSTSKAKKGKGTKTMTKKATLTNKMKAKKEKYR